MTFARIAARLAATTIRRLGNHVTIALVEGRGQLNAPMERVIDGMVVFTGWELEYVIADFPVVLRGEQIVIDGVNYTAREDGLVTGDQATGMVPLERETDQEDFEYIIDGNDA